MLRPVPHRRYSIAAILAVHWVSFVAQYNRWKNHYLSQARRALKQADHDDTQTERLALWAERQTEYTGIDPLICPNCDQPLTYIGTFFGNWSELQSLFDSAGKDSVIPYALLRPG
jgi:hypothetical protein